MGEVERGGGGVGGAGQRIGCTPAQRAAGFTVKPRALACEWEDDLEDHQLRRLHALAREMERAA